MVIPRSLKQSILNRYNPKLLLCGAMHTGSEFIDIGLCVDTSLVEWIAGMKPVKNGLHL